MKKRKFLCYLLSVLMIVGAFSAISFADQTVPAISAGSTSVIEGTETVAIPITVAGEIPYAACGLKVSCADASATAVSVGDALTAINGYANVNSGNAYITGAGTSNGGTDGTLATVTFDVSELTPGTYTVNVEEGAAHGSGCFTSVSGVTFTELNPTFTAGTITVTASPTMTINGVTTSWKNITGKTTADHNWVYYKKGAASYGKVNAGDTIVMLSTLLGSTPACCVQVTSDKNATITAADGNAADWSDTALYVGTNGAFGIAVDGAAGNLNINSLLTLTSYTSHNVTAHPAVPKTSCTTAGNTAYWSCDQCGKYFSDEACTTAVEENSWVIPAGHTLDADGICTVCQTRRYEPEVTETTAAAAVPETIIVTENEAITMDVSSTEENITKNEVAIPAAAMDQLKTANSVTMTTNVGTLTFDKAALGRIDTAAEENAVTISLESVSKPDGLPASEGEEVKYIELNATAGENPVFAGDGDGTATVSLDYPAPAEGKFVKVNFIDNTSRTAVTASYANGKVSFTIGHFSTYEIVTVSGYAVTVEDKTNNVATVTPSGDVVTVTCTKPCVAVYTTDGGTTYNRMTAVAAGTENTYTFTATADCTVVVALKGDVNLDGKVNATDSGNIKRSLLSTGEMKIDLATLNEKLADVDNSGKKNISDFSAVKRSLLSGGEMYQALTW